MIGAPPTKHEKLLACETVVKALDRQAREIEQRWGIGRLPMLAGIEWAERFRSQQQKFSRALWEWDVDEVRKHGEAMQRAYAKLESLALEAGYQPMPPEQWEFQLPDGSVVILVRDKARICQADTGGRQVSVWSVDEIVSILTNYPALSKMKEAFPGAEIVSIGVEKFASDALNDELGEVPFA